MTDPQHLNQLDAVQVEINRLSRQAFERLLELLRNEALGLSPREAIQAVQAEFTGAFKWLLMAEFNKILVSAIGVAELNALQIGGLTLSQRLYQHSREVSAVALHIINEHAKGFHDARKLALQLYEGYNFRPNEPVEGRSPLPKYLKRAFGDDEAFMQLWNKNYAHPALKGLAKDATVGPSLARILARAQAETLKTPALKASYLQALDALEKGAGEQRLANVLRTAYHEKNRYFANRIAQTELHRAYTDRRAAEIMAEPAFKAVKFRMSSTHPKTDICNLFAEIDKFGMGPGVYPKADAPKPPLHPFCRCVANPLAWSPGEPRENPDAERQFLRSMPLKDAAQVMGGGEKLQKILKGSSLDTVLNEGKDKLYHLKRLGEFGVQSPGMTLNEVYKRAEKTKPSFDARIKQWADDYSADAVTTELKNKNRAQNKINRLYSGDAGLITDVLRATLLTDTAGDVGPLYDAIKAKIGSDIIDSRNNYATQHHSSDGYFDAKIDFMFNGLKTELQIHSKAMYNAIKQAHDLYEQRQRVLQNGAALTAEQRNAIKAINKAMREIFRGAAK